MMIVDYNESVGDRVVGVAIKRVPSLLHDVIGMHIDWAGEGRSSGSVLHGLCRLLISINIEFNCCNPIYM